MYIYIYEHVLQISKPQSIGVILHGYESCYSIWQHNESRVDGPVWGENWTASCASWTSGQGEWARCHSMTVGLVNPHGLSSVSMGHFFQSYVKERTRWYIIYIYIYMVKIGDRTVYKWDLWWVRLWLDDVRWADRVYPVRFLDVDVAWLCWKPKMIHVASGSSWNRWRFSIWIKAVEVMFMAQDRSSSRRHHPYPKFLLHLLVLGVIIDYPSYYPLSLPKFLFFLLCLKIGNCIPSIG